MTDAAAVPVSSNVPGKMAAEGDHRTRVGTPHASNAPAARSARRSGVWAATVYSAIRSAAVAVSASGGISATMITVAAARTTPKTMTWLPRRQASGMRHPAVASHHQELSAPARPPTGPTVTAARTSGTARSARAGWCLAHATALQTPCCRRPRSPGSGGMSLLFSWTTRNGGHADAGPADGTRVDDTEASGMPPVDSGEHWRQEEREQVAEGW